MAKNIEITPPPDLRGPLTLSLLGEAIKAKRAQNRLTQSEAAFIAGLSKPTYRKIEQGSSDVQVTSLMKVISALGIQILIRPWPNRETTNLVSKINTDTELETQ